MDQDTKSQGAFGCWVTSGVSVKLESRTRTAKELINLSFNQWEMDRDETESTAFSHYKIKASPRNGKVPGKRTILNLRIAKKDP